MVQGLIEATIQIVGWAVLKAATLGRYRLDRPGDLGLVEGAVGLTTIAVISYLVYRFWN